VSKVSSIRKKALGYAKKRQWQEAIREFVRLSEIEANNPNVFNELGDLYLKVGQKRDAFQSFESAIDAYSSVGLHNNAVAVCKKILRLSPDQRTVYAKLAKLRMQQGFHREAVAAYKTYLEMVVQDIALSPEALKNDVCQVAAEARDAPDVLEKVVEYLLKWEFVEDAGKVLMKLHHSYGSRGMSAEKDAVMERIREIGYKPSQEDFDATAGEAAAGAQDHAERGERLPVGEGQPEQAVGTADAAGERNVAYNFGTVEIGAEAASGSGSARTQTATEDPEASPAEAGGVEADPVPDRPGERSNEAVTELPGEDAAAAEGGQPAREGDEVWMPGGDSPGRVETMGDGSEGDYVQVSDIVDQFKSEVVANIDEEDYRSHYDLGMAYLEMDLLPEAIREFQFASNSGMYRVRSLEMIGLCFLKQKQPRLAMKQLQKGLELVGNDDRESLGLLYNLGLAYEMMNERDKAKTCFEDVYVVDVTFRDVEEKVRKNSS
jgi:tetratricopeptide (TPR) repeat protein